MDADLFLQQFGHLAQGEGGIKKLRDVILQLAVRGKLVEQNPADEPAEVLLKKIEAERKQQEKEGKIKKRLLAKYENSFLREPLPKGWRPVCIDHVILEMKSGGTPSKANASYWTNDDGIFWASVKDLKFGQKYISSTQDKITTSALGDGKTKIAKAGEFLICTRMGLGKISICTCDMAFNQDLKAVSISSFIDANYFHLFFQTLTIKGTGTTVDGIVQEKLLAYPLPLPPLAEQKRIVVKVDELMALCDKLEAEQKAQRTLKTQAVQSTLHHLTNAESPANFGTSLNILERTFDNWFDDLATVKHLRATILQLAVQGKLVPQNPTDEPSSVLLKRIDAEKKRLVKEGKIKAPKGTALVAESDIPFPVPSSWEWIRLGQAGIVSTGGTPRTNDADLYGTDIPFIGPGQITQSGRILEADKGLSDKGRDHTSVAQAGDILMVCIGGSIGKAAIAEKETAFNQQINCLSPLLIENRYAYAAMSAPNFFNAVLDKATGSATPIINLSKWSEIAIPLPPLAEQKRIVTKVDELMTLCDQLEAHITHTQTLNTHLMDSLIHRMTEAA